MNVDNLIVGPNGRSLAGVGRKTATNITTNSAIAGGQELIMVVQKKRRKELFGQRAVVLLSPIKRFKWDLVQVAFRELCVVYFEYTICIGHMLLIVKEPVM